MVVVVFLGIYNWRQKWVQIGFITVFLSILIGYTNNKNTHDCLADENMQMFVFIVYFPVLSTIKKWCSFIVINV